MPLDPKARELLDQLAAMGAPPLETLPVPQAREMVATMATLQGEAEPVARVENRRIPGPDGDIPVRIYVPEGRAPLPVVVYFHGGGWVICDLDSHDGACRSLANAARAIVVSVDYRLAPEHKFPAAPQDCYAATAWAAKNAASFGGDPERLAVGGDSAGGNLAAVVSLMARERGGPKLRFQLLVYPVTDGAAETPSYRENGEGYFLTVSMMRWFWKHYLNGPADAENPHASPLRARSLEGLPPALVITAEFDPLRDEGEIYARKLREAGVDAELRRYDGIIHGFFTMAGALPHARRAVEEGGAALRRAFGTA